MSSDLNDGLPARELQRRVVFAVMAAAARMARVFSFDLKELRALLDAAYYQELRLAKLTQKEIGHALKVSERTAVKLSRQAREQFMEATVEHNLPRRIEFMLGAESMGRKRIAQLVTPFDVATVNEAIDDLLAKGRIREVKGRTTKYRPASPARSLQRDSILARIGGLNSFVENLTNAVYGRFFAPESRSFVRTLSFRGGPEIFEELEGFYAHRVLPGLREMNSEGSGPDAREVQVSICWAPYEFIQVRAGAEEAEGAE